MAARPIRVLHFIGDFGGGDGHWLRHLLKRIDREQIAMDFLVARHQAHTYDSEITSFGARIFHGDHPPYLEGICLNFRRIVRQYGPYDIFHAHANYSSGYTLYLAEKLGVPVRIAHSHLDTRPTDKMRGPMRRSYQRIAEFLVRKSATAGIGVSRQAAAALFGPDWRRDPRWRVMYLGIDFSPYSKGTVSSAIRAELNIPEQAFVVGHVGRFHSQKNHDFFVEIAEVILRQEPEARFILIGDGPLRNQIEEKIVQAGIMSQFLITGVRSDVPRLLMGVIDVLLFPSFYEGLGIVLLEAQAAGVPYVCSDVIPEEADVVPGMAQRLPLSSSPDVWATAVLEKRDRGSLPTQAAALQAIEESAFDLDAGTRELVNLYVKLAEESER
jgi:glycosyltransferase involved in cell wall biosynthesis